MAEQTQFETLNFLDDKGNIAATLRLYAPPAEPDSLIRLSDAEAKEYGEEPLQVCEGRRYEYEIEPIRGLNFRLALANDYTNEILEPSRIPEHIHCGQIVPGLRTGCLGLTVRNEAGETAGTAAIEIFSKKVGYRDDYRTMMEDITEQCVSLLMDLRSPTDIKVIPDPGNSPETIHQRFAFLRSLIGSHHFQNALHRITTHPHRRWEPEENICDIRRGFRPDARSLRQLARGSRRVPLPEEHPLKSDVPSLPERINAYRNIQTDDTPENRFVKFAIKSFSGFLNKMRLKLGKLGNGADARLQEEIKSLESRLESALAAEIFRGVSDPDMLPLGSPVLQRKEGYREILQAWLKFDMAARLVWRGGDDVYGAGQRDIAALYEYWVYFKLLDIVSDIFKLDKPAATELIEKTPDGFGLKLKSGEYLPIEGLYVSGWRPLRVKFSYNRTYSFNATHTFRGSWSRNMRPDYTLSIWPDDFHEEEAEAQELMVHIHFDAKYRIEHITELFGSEEADLNEEKVQQRAGRYKRADLLKMHAYRDAIRRTRGAYVLYPGTETGQWKGYHEILPGLGAFPLRPGDGDAVIEDFIRKVVEHVCDRATASERESYHVYKAHEMPVPYQGIRRLPEREAISLKRHIPPSETFVLVGWCKSDEHLKWILREKLYNCRMDSGRGSLELSPEMTAAKYLLLHFENGRAVPGLMRITSKGPRVFSRDALMRKGYPGTPSQEFYLVYKVELAAEFDGANWDYSKLDKQMTGRTAGFPFPVPLDAVLATELKEEK
jgi:predicted component of viral defense system (DUF524 family)